MGLTFWESKARRFTRQAAQAQLDKFIQRCRQLNDQAASINYPESIIQVDAVFLFGSFARESDEVGDMDIALTLSVRDQGLLRQYLANSRGKPIQEMLSITPDALALKSLRKGLNILSVGLRLPEGVTGEIVFQRQE